MPLQKVRDEISSPKSREGVDPDPGAPDDPGPPALKAGVDQIGIGDVLQPARHRVEAAATAAVGIRDPGPHFLLEGPAARPVD